MFIKFFRSRWISFVIAAVVMLILAAASILCTILMFYDEDLVNELPLLVSGLKFSEVSEHFNILSNCGLILAISLFSLQFVAWATFFLFLGQTERQDLYLLRLKEGLGGMAWGGALFLLVCASLISGLSFGLGYGISVAIDVSYLGLGMRFFRLTGTTMWFGILQALVVPLFYLLFMILPLSGRRGLLRAIKEIND